MAKPLILVVEDNDVLQKVIFLLSKQCGVDADMVSNGQDALSAVVGLRDYGLILMDWRLPDMDGLECTRQIRAWEQSTGSHLPIIAMTANVATEDRRACLEVGMDDYMSKPFTSEEFATMLNRWLSASPNERRVC